MPQRPENWKESKTENGIRTMQMIAEEARRRGAAVTVCLYSISPRKAQDAQTRAEARRRAAGIIDKKDYGFQTDGEETAVLFQSTRHGVRERLERLQEEIEGLCWGLVELLPEHEVTVEEALLLARERMYEQQRGYHIHLNEQRRLEAEGRLTPVPFDYNQDLLYDALVQSTDAYIFICNMKTGVFRYTKKMVEEFELPGEVIENAAAVWGARVHENDRPAFLEANQEIADGRVSSHCVEYRARNRSGQWVWIRCRGHLEFDEQGEPELFAGFITNLGKRNRIDHLTGLFNRLEFEEDVCRLMEKEPRVSFGVMTLGIDDLKHINDLYGRTFGDEVIRIASQRLQSLLPEGTLFYRMDGDEFGIVVQGCSYEDNIRRMEQIYRIVGHLFGSQQEYEGKKYACTLSAGCLVYPDHVEDYDTLMQYAGYTLEYSKRHGKKRCTFFSEDILSQRIRKLKMVELLRESAENDCAGFSLCYQPIVGAEDGRLIGMEALARWQREPFGQVSPVEFVPLLEESGLIVPVGRWVLKTALHVCRAWLEQCPALVLHVNVSFVQIQNSSFAKTVLQEVEQAQFPPENLVLELTESYFASGNPAISQTFQELRSHKIRVAMDDFGTGYSTLGLLKETPADIVKIDRAFVRDIRNSHFDATFIRFIVALCHDAGSQVCLEGVETEEEYHLVSRMGLDMIQGFLFSRPLPEQAFAKRYIH